ncbi:MAG TPA: hypothetical protein VMR97_05895 [Acidimicrobiales bacterium]|nr:hypothetical protein [Acidimicrobiales bacterium]
MGLLGLFAGLLADIPAPPPGGGSPNPLGGGSSTLLVLFVVILVLVALVVLGLLLRYRKRKQSYDGAARLARAANPTGQVSPDGRWVWDGWAWRPRQ